MLLQAALNGPWTKDDHPAVPVSADELARDAAACVAAGAGAVHLHPRDAEGRERLDATVVDSVVERVRAAHGRQRGAGARRGLLRPVRMMPSGPGAAELRASKARRAPP
jgi:uncharacterized protein (DUF849 family)